MFILSVALALSCGAAVTRAGSLLLGRAQAQACADAVALAFVSGGMDSALQVARVTHSRIIDSGNNGNAVHVTVRTMGITASATAAG